MRRKTRCCRQGSESCKGVLEDQLEAIDPKVILALGRPAAQTLLDTTREAVLSVTDIARPVKSPWGGMKSGASATFEIKRSDFGMTYSKVLETGGLVVGDAVKYQGIKVGRGESDRRIVRGAASGRTRRWPVPPRTARAPAPSPASVRGVRCEGPGCWTRPGSPTRGSGPVAAG